MCGTIYKRKNPIRFIYKHKTSIKNDLTVLNNILYMLYNSLHSAGRSPSFTFTFWMHWHLYLECSSVVELWRSQLTDLRKLYKQSNKRHNKIFIYKERPWSTRQSIYRPVTKPLKSSVAVYHKMKHRKVLKAQC